MTFLLDSPDAFLFQGTILITEVEKQTCKGEGSAEVGIVSQVLPGFEFQILHLVSGVSKIKKVTHKPMHFTQKPE